MKTDGKGKAHPLQAMQAQRVWYFGIFRELCWENLNFINLLLLNSSQNKKCLTKVVEKIKTHILCSVFPHPQKIVTFMR